jgi:hypothetical protein
MVHQPILQTEQVLVFRVYSETVVDAGDGIIRPSRLKQCCSKVLVGAKRSWHVLIGSEKHLDCLGRLAILE